MNHTPAALLRGIVKDRGRFRLGPLNLTFARGEVTALVGPNGSGKTTLLKILLGLVAPDGGQAEVLGQSPDLLPVKVGAVLDTGYLVPDWRVDQACAAVAGAGPDWDDALAADLVGRFGVPPRAKVKELSRGEGSKLKLALALATGPELLILDEPTSGLDPLAREQVLQVIREFMVDESHTVLFSTHIPTDLPGIADQLVALRQGAVVEDCRMDELDERYFSVRGVVSDLPSSSGVLVGVRRTATNFTAVVPSGHTAGLPSGLVVEEATIDDIAKALAVPAEGASL